MEFLAGSLLELITETSTNLPPDVRAAMNVAAKEETPDTQSSQAFDIILSNIDMAADDAGPICQDTGMPTFIIHTPVGANQIRIRKAIYEAVAEATRRDMHLKVKVERVPGLERLLQRINAVAEVVIHEHGRRGRVKGYS